MKELDEEALRKIAYNCRKATFLIEKRQLRKISSAEQLELEIHLAGCAACVTFMKQSAIINQMVRKIFTLASDMPKLAPAFKKHLQDVIDKLNEK